MIVFKILAAPVMVALSLLAAMVTFLFCGRGLTKMFACKRQAQ